MDYSSSNKESFVISKAKWIFSSLTGVMMLWASRLASPMHQIPKHFHFCRCRLHHHHQAAVAAAAGLRSLIRSSREAPSILHQNPNFPSLVITTSNMASPFQSPTSTTSSTSTSSFVRSLTHSSSWSSATDDFLGTESGVYMNSDFEPESEAAVHNRKLTKRRERRSAMLKEYPPALPTRRVLTRHCENGNLVLKDEGVKNHYIETTRKNGRLIVNLVQLNDNNNKEELECLAMETDQAAVTDEFLEREVTNDDHVDNDEYQETEANEEEEEEAKFYQGSITITATRPNMVKKCSEDDDDDDTSFGELRKCLTYTGRRSSEFCEINFRQLLTGSAPLAATHIARRVTPVTCS